MTNLPRRQESYPSYPRLNIILLKHTTITHLPQPSQGATFCLLVSTSYQRFTISLSTWAAFLPPLQPSSPQVWPCILWPSTCLYLRARLRLDLRYHERSSPSFIARLWCFSLACVSASITLLLLLRPTRQLLYRQILISRLSLPNLISAMISWHWRLHICCKTRSSSAMPSTRAKD